MISIVQNELTTIVFNPFRLSRTFLRYIFAIMLGFFGFSMPAFADVVSDRKDGFRANAAAIRAIAAAIGSGDYLTVINRAEKISSWAEKIPSHFPIDSRVGDTKARVEIWTNFDHFTALSKANKNAAKRLIVETKSRDQGAMMTGLKSLGASCKACHKLYKD